MYMYIVHAHVEIPSDIEKVTMATTCISTYMYM